MVVDTSLMISVKIGSFKDVKKKKDEVGVVPVVSVGSYKSVDVVPLFRLGKKNGGGRFI